MIYDKYEILYGVLMNRADKIYALSNVGFVWKAYQEGYYNPSVLKVSDVVKLKGSYDLGETESESPLFFNSDATLYIDESSQYIMCHFTDGIINSELFNDKAQMMKLIKNNFDTLSKFNVGRYIRLIGVDTRTEPYSFLNSSTSLVVVNGRYVAGDSYARVKYGKNFGEFISKYNELELTLDEKKGELIVEFR